ncbi:hypothetical protein ACQB6R_08710 [Propionibacteriaceae bacterium G1746]|uniref:hypothetical protein n=1 Tax=Aestuariimicrobium sp. G57 TaxID=3418485 RepID=UPI003C1CBD3B
MPGQNTQHDRGREGFLVSRDEGNPFVEPDATEQIPIDDITTQEFDDPATGTRPYLDVTMPDPGFDEPDEGEATLVDLNRDAVLSSRAAKPARTRHRWGLVVFIGLLVLLLIGAVVAVSAEVIARREVNGRVAGALSQAFNTTATATLHDDVALWSLARGRLGKITIAAPDSRITRDKQTITFKSIDGTATNITDPTNPDKTVIGGLDATVVMSWDELRTLSGVDIRPAEGGSVQVDRTISIFGADIGVQVTAVPVIDAGTRRIVLQDPKARAAQVSIPAALINDTIAKATQQLVLPELPHITYQQLKVTDAGISLQVTGTNVPLKDLG